jgi:hypothetical protein
MWGGINCRPRFEREVWSRDGGESQTAVSRGVEVTGSVMTWNKPIGCLQFDFQNSLCRRMLRIIKKIARCVKQPADVELLLVMSAYNRDRIFPLLKAMRPMTLVTAEQEQLLQMALQTEGAAMQMRVARAVLDNKSLRGRSVWEGSANLVKQVCWANVSRYDLTVMPNLVEALRTMCSLKLIEPALRPVIYGMGTRPRDAFAISSDIDVCLPSLGKTRGSRSKKAAGGDGAGFRSYAFLECQGLSERRSAAARGRRGSVVGPAGHGTKCLSLCDAPIAR